MEKHEHVRAFCAHVNLDLCITNTILVIELIVFEMYKEKSAEVYFFTIHESKASCFFNFVASQVATIQDALTFLTPEGPRKFTYPVPMENINFVCCLLF